MQGRMFRPNETDEAKRIADMIAKDPDKDWNGFLNSVTAKDKSDLLVLSQGQLFEMHARALDNISSTADSLFMLLQLNILINMEANPDNNDTSYRDLCMSIAKTIADPERKLSLKESVGSAQIRYESNAYLFLINGFDFNRDAADKITRAIGLLETYLTLSEVEAVVEPPKL